MDVICYYTRIVQKTFFKLSFSFTKKLVQYAFLAITLQYLTLSFEFGARSILLYSTF
jgi:hypothetical protein